MVKQLDEQKDKKYPKACCDTLCGLVDKTGEVRMFCDDRYGRTQFIWAIREAMEERVGETNFLDPELCKEDIFVIQQFYDQGYTLF